MPYTCVICLRLIYDYVYNSGMCRNATCNNIICSNCRSLTKKSIYDETCSLKCMIPLFSNISLWKYGKISLYNRDIEDDQMFIYNKLVYERLIKIYPNVLAKIISEY